jgi:hypothetical protein
MPHSAGIGSATQVLDRAVLARSSWRDPLGSQWVRR